jgi:hypothetical protein
VTLPVEVPEYAGEAPVPLYCGDTLVAEYVLMPTVDSVRGSRPFLHPVRTLHGTVVTDVLPEDHRHHLGVSVAMQDVNGSNLWGGRTYVRGSGYTWLDDHGRIEHTGWVSPPERERLAHTLRWYGHDGAPLLDEQRLIVATELAGRDAWALTFEYILDSPHGTVTLGSPATNGRPGKAGYGGFFWRASGVDGPPPALLRQDSPSDDADDEESVNGAGTGWVALRRDAYTLVFSGLGRGDHWFVRAAEYPGVCAALAFTRPRRLAPGGALLRRLRIVVADGGRTRREIETLTSAARNLPTSRPKRRA